MSESNRSGSFGLRLIGAFKLVGGVLLIALGIGVFRQANADLGGEVGRLVAALKIDPDSYYIHRAIAMISGIKPAQLKAIGVGTFLYALLYLAEAVGLLLRKRWGEYLTVVATGLFIPLEIYESAKRATPIRIGLLVVNAAILVYVISQLRRPKPGGPPDGVGPDPPRP